MKFKVLKDFISSILNGIEGKTHDLELDEPTSKMWTEHGLIEEIKEEPASEVVSNAASEPTQEPEEAARQDTVSTPDMMAPAAPPEEVAPSVTPAPEAVTADETK